ncbi:MAG TPA: hypothetical protein VNZ62_14120 [Capillimicrobium sp.]|nr:hypothetical protein [Capillimicrobium sp.]
MPAQPRTRTPVGDAFSEGGGMLASLGIFVMVLFPFAIPAIVLGALLLVPLLVVGLVAGVLAAPLLAVRALRGGRS